MNKIILLLIILIIPALALLAFVQNRNKTGDQPTPTPTSTHSSPSTSINQNPGWKTFTDPIQQVNFQYPETISTKYILPQKWPPTITVLNSSFSCKEGGQIGSHPLVIQKSVGSMTYCIENMTQGAAGTFYSDYTYSFIKEGKLISLKFTVAYPQCDNYPEPKKSDCQNERQTFNLDSLIDQIARSVSGNLSPSPSAPIVTLPKPNTKVTSPLVVSGTVPAGWMFEGVLPIKLLDSDRQLIVQSQAKEVVAGSWTSGKDAAFKATLIFTQPKTTTGFLVLDKDNPSGLPENSATFEIPITF